MIRHFAYARIEPDSHPDYKFYVASVFYQFLESVNAKPLDKEGQIIPKELFLAKFSRTGWNSLISNFCLEWKGKSLELKIEKDFGYNSRSEGIYDENGCMIFRRGLTFSNWSNKITSESESLTREFLGELEKFLVTTGIEHKFVKYNQNGHSLDK